MIRPFFTELGLFLAPFVLYAAFLLATRAGVLQPRAWTLPRLAGLVVASLALRSRLLQRVVDQLLPAAVDGIITAFEARARASDRLAKP